MIQVLKFSFGCNFGGVELIFDKMNRFDIISTYLSLNGGRYKFKPKIPIKCFYPRLSISASKCLFMYSISPFHMFHPLHSQTSFIKIPQFAYLNRTKKEEKKEVLVNSSKYFNICNN